MPVTSPDADPASGDIPGPAFSLEPGHNCWRVARADRFALIVDAADYFRALRAALADARQMTVMIGWDFDFEIDMLPGESDADGCAPDGLPNNVGDFLAALVDRRPELDIYLLKWSGGALIAPGRILPALRLNMGEPAQIHLAFDGHHPIGACHHQKIVVIDDSIAFCGGIDVTDGRWDTVAHRTGDPRRRLKDGTIAPPWHDAAAVLNGDAAAALGALARARWARARSAPLPEALTARPQLWPVDIKPDFEDIPVGIARTRSPGRGETPIVEVEQLYLDAIHRARRSIYLESQYFASESIARAIARRLSEADGPEVVIINPVAAQSTIEDAAMHTRRSTLLRRIEAADQHGRFRMYYPVNTTGEAIYVHAKLLIVDDWLLRVGSSNIDRRSMGYDTEADVAVVARTPAERASIQSIRARLLAEHLDTAPVAVEVALGDTSMIATIDALNQPHGRRLCAIAPREHSLLARLVANSRVLDPRFQRSARNRLGLTNRHLLLGLGGLALVAVLSGRRRGR